MTMFGAVDRLALVRTHVLEDALGGLDVLRRPFLEVVEVQVQTASRDVLGERSLERRVGRVLTVAHAVAVGELGDEAALGRALDERVEAVECEQVGVERMS